VLVITAQRHRTQARNRDDARARLIDLIRRAAVPPAPRRPTRPPARSRRERLETKKRRGGLKRLRTTRPPAED
jgi:ribosome-associated protein